MNGADVFFVVATDRRGAIGRDGRLPWHLPADLAHFRRLTLGHPVIMGRKTHASVGRPLPSRTNIVLTRDPAYAATGCIVAHSVDEALRAAGPVRIAVIGGAAVFDAFSHVVREVFVTEVDADVDGDTFYRAPDRPIVASEVLERRPPDERNAFAMTFRRVEYA